MRPPTIPDTLAICSVCNDAFAMAGKQQCCDCLLATRFAAWALADGHAAQHPPRVFGEQRAHGAGLRFVGDAITKSFVPAEAVGYLPPRITEVPRSDALPAWQQLSAAAALQAMRLCVWALWAVVVAFTCGWLLGRFGC